MIAKAVLQNSITKIAIEKQSGQECLLSAGGTVGEQTQGVQRAGN